ncbi:type I restriction enzyme HsdR N-terminal domain-containing protein [Parvibaculum sp.]|uniref:type I restriction enzyme HsdR N-terminal domain-containing protein n=1 Tax=Parvibaculum sp. TaxID=2024848 RepID=UPI0026186B5E|nr:type I restriction enzyme HsdR N-terminal domain-containing protein [Parvibaculum sp.]MCW5726244.1 hypothetical protein [Parvibaculum sp.]
MDPTLSNLIDIEQLMLFKSLEPLKPEQIAVLQHIQDYKDVEKYNEAEVRSYIIDPILRVLGYDKDTPFSSNLESHLYFLGQKRRSDYQVTLWEENFWLIEAKRPQVGEANFNSQHFEQALEYSVHPSVDAALVVLCDGLKIEIFDREASVDAPLLHVDIKNLVADFDKLRAILEPMQIWFFQKRRIIRLIDRIFDKEFVMDRVEEFSDIVTRRLRRKSQRVVENFRNVVKADETNLQKAAETASLVELTELFMKYDNPVAVDNAINRRLVALSIPGSFRVMNRIFPDGPRPANDSFMAQAGTYLLALAQERDTVEWAPAWLAQGNQAKGALEPIAKFYLDQCLTYFEDSHPHRLVLLAANAAQRIAKIYAISSAATQNLGKELHALARFRLPELSWAQILASPERELIGIIDSQTNIVLADFVAKNTDTNGHFKVESAKLQLREYWDLEKKLLAALPNYKKLLEERSLGEIRMIEWSSVTYDNLAHSLLCRITPRFPKWRDYLLAERRPQLEKVAAMGSWAARKMLNVNDCVSLSDQEIADRFFLGDVETLCVLRSAYRGQERQQA